MASFQRHHVDGSDWQDSQVPRSAGRDAELTVRGLNRATLERQLLLERSEMPVEAALEHLLGLQAQTPQTWYAGMWSRLRDFEPETLSAMLAERRAVRIALMRSTIHLVSARDAWGLRPLVQPAHDRMLQGNFGARLAGLDRDEVVREGRAIVDGRPVTFKQLGDTLLERWPGTDPAALSALIRTAVPLVQVPPHGLWRRSGAAAHTSIDAWLGESPADLPSIDDVVVRYLRAFGPASVMDAQTWSGLTKLGEVFERLRPRLVSFRDDTGRELFDLPDAPRPDPDTPAPARYLYDYDNLLLSHADRRRFLDPTVPARVPGTANAYPGTFLVDGFVAGTWEVVRNGGRRDATTLLIRPAVGLTAADREALQAEGSALLAFLAPDGDNADVRVEADGGSGVEAPRA
jgi:hypothetical protein